jgi:hypothetical protein
MTTETSHTNPLRVFRGFDAAVERTLGVDARLLYGMTVPVLMICGLICLLALAPQTWLVILILVVEIAALGVVVAGFAAMLNDDADEERDRVG